MTDLESPEPLSNSDSIPSQPSSGESVSAYNPLDYLQVLRWLIFDTNRVRDLRDSAALRQIAMRLTGFFVWLPVFLVVLARPLGVLPTPDMLFSPWVGVLGVIAGYIISVVYVPDGPRARAIRTAALIATVAIAVGITIGIRVEGGFFRLASREQSALFGVAVGSGFAMGIAFALLFVNSNFVRPVAGVLIMIVTLLGQASVNILLLTSVGVGFVMAIAIYPIRQKEDQHLQIQNMPIRIMYAIMIILSNFALIRLIYLN